MKGKFSGSFRTNSFKYGTYSLIVTVIVIAIVIGINFAIRLLPSGMQYIDISEKQLYSIGEKTEEILDQVDDDITIYLISTNEEADKTITQTVQKYADYSKYITIKRVNPDRDPSFLKNYDVKTSDLASSELESGDIRSLDTSRCKTDIIVESKNRYKFISGFDIYEYQEGNQALTMYQVSRDSSYLAKNYDGEGEITSAINYVIATDLPKIYILTGHDEFELDASVVELLKKNNINYESIDLLSAEKVPDDCKVLLINNLCKDLGTSEVEKLEEYVAVGGNCMIFHNTANTENTPNYDKFLEYFGVSIQDKAFIFEVQEYCCYPERYVLYETLAEGTYTTDIVGKKIVASFATPIVTLEDKRKTLVVNPILSTSSGSWLRTELNNSMLDEKISSDEDGPFDFAVSIVDATNTGKGTILLYSSYDFLMLDKLSESVPNNVNGELFINSLLSFSKLSKKVSIAAKSSTYSKNTASAQEFNFNLIIYVVVIPVTILILGFVIWLVRRRR